MQLMMDAVHQYDGFVAQALGDGIFALFGAPIAHEDHPQRAVYAALRMQDAMLQLSFYAYFHSEEGLGAHPHDIEPVEFKMVAVQRTDPTIREEVACSRQTYILLVSRTAAKAHGLRWYWNVLESDKYTQFPMHILVEEGRHGLATDKNSDGYFTPGFDVNKGINDAWGARDVIRQGTLLSGKYEGWMAKVRTPQYRVFPPLPEDSPLQPALKKRKGRGSYATYELWHAGWRGWPSAGAC